MKPISFSHSISPINMKKMTLSRLRQDSRELARRARKALGISTAFDPPPHSEASPKESLCDLCPHKKYLEGERAHY